MKQKVKLCEDCSHCKIINKHRIYSFCDRDIWFHPFVEITDLDVVNAIADDCEFYDDMDGGRYELTEQDLIKDLMDMPRLDNNLKLEF